MNERDGEKTTLITPCGLYEFQVMTFGLCNAPAPFESTIYNVLSKLRWTSCPCYLGDIVIFGSNLQDYDERLEHVSRFLSHAGLLINSKKCNFSCQEQNILGHLVTLEGVRLHPKKKSAVSDFRRPGTLKHVRSFLGLCCYFKRFVPHHTSKAQSLQVLLRNDTNLSGIEIKSVHSLFETQL